MQPSGRNTTWRDGWHYSTREKELLNYGELEKVRQRRNDIAHELNKPADTAALDWACAEIQRQLIDWGLVDNSLPPPTGV